MTHSRPQLALPLALLVAALAGILVAVEAAGGAGGACTPGVRQLNGGLVRVFCGPAAANVTVGRAKIAYRQGQCDRTAAYFTINIGTTALDLKVKPKPAYFGITVGRTPLTPASPRAGKDGSYTAGVVTFVRKGKVTTLRAGAKVTLQRGRTMGTFTGIADSGQPVRGSFRC